MNKQLLMGKRIEAEHKGTIKYIKKYVTMHKKLPPAKRIYLSIAKDHLKENKKYYTKLKKAHL